ncbi:MAG: Smr/MutS family protein [Myxococcales bacterium]|nr:Smr/MutS family protein [Myxococcales bacterium]
MSYGAAVDLHPDNGGGDAAEQRTSHDLEWGYLLDHLAGSCVSTSAAARMRALRPERSVAAARARMTLTAEALAASVDDAPIPARGLPELDQSLPRVAKGSVASGEELRDISRLLEASRTLRAYAQAQTVPRPSLAAALGSAASLEPLAELLSSSIEADGSVADSASPALRDARRRVGEVRRELGSRLSQLMRRYSEVLRDDYWTEHDGRFVLPVRSDAHLRVNGIVLGSSASGATLYVEPEEVTQLGNRLKVAEAEVEREVARVLAVLSAEVTRHAPELAAALEACLEADRLAALCRFAEETRSIALMPTDAPHAALTSMRHPLLVMQGIRVIPNDITLAGGTALVISGPNAGGKTVALKALGLAAWMVRAGIPVPTEPGSELGFFEPVLTDVGDEQSLQFSLSTFSAHVKNLASILERSGDRALVLLDEVAAGTDPEEGSALAAALLEALVERGAAVAVTTHYERLKELGAGGGPLINASMGFDLGKMEPTFRLTIGVPGASSALAVALRYGVPTQVIERAQELLPHRALDREELVQKLEAERSTLEAARRDAEEELRRQRLLTAEIEEQRAKARAEERALLAAESRELLAEVRRARAELQAAKHRVDRGDASRSELKQAEKSVNEAARQVALGGALELATRAPMPARTGQRPAAEADLSVGTRVFLKQLGQHGEVIDPPNKGVLKVAVGSIKLTVRIDELEVAKAKPPGAKQATKKVLPKAALEVQDGFVPVRTTDNTLDLRGQRVDEALDAVDAFVDQMLRVGERVAYILHGHGTGALKLAVRAHLSAHSLVKRSRPAESDDGGDAFTVLSFDR